MFVYLDLITPYRMGWFRRIGKSTVFYTTYFSILSFVIVTGVIFASYTWKNRYVTDARFFTYSAINSTFWALCLVFSMLSHSPAGAYFWAMPMRLISAATSAIFSFGFSLEYMGYYEWLQRKRFSWLFVIPIFVIVASYFRPDLFFASTYVLEKAHFLLVQRASPGFLYYLSTAYSTSVTILCISLLLVYGLQSNNTYRFQVFLLISSIVVPGLLNLANTFVPFGVYLDLTPLGFIFTYVIWGWAIYRVQFLSLIPIAHSTILQGMQDCILVIDTEERFVELNTAAKQLMGSIGANIIGQPMHALFNHDIFEKHVSIDKERGEIKINQHNELKYYSFEISTLYRRRNNVAGRVVVLRDITARRLAEIEREKLIEDLNAYAHMVAHDLKSPLNVIIGYTELATLTDAQQPIGTIEPYLEAIDRTGNKMASIINELLLLASIRQLDHIEAQPLDMASIIGGAIERFAPLIQETEAKITLADDFPTALGYAPWIEEVYANYISNAIKYGGTPPHIEIGATRQDSGVIRFWVQDNGLGLTLEQQSMVFEQFTCFEQNTADGHGLGLSIVQRIIDKLGGNVGVQSVLNQGSRFYFTLPADPST